MAAVARRSLDIVVTWSPTTTMCRVWGGWETGDTGGTARLAPYLEQYTYRIFELSEFKSSSRSPRLRPCPVLASFFSHVVPSFLNISIAHRPGQTLASGSCASLRLLPFVLPLSLFPCPPRPSLTWPPRIIGSDSSSASSLCPKGRCSRAAFINHNSLAVITAVLSVFSPSWLFA